MIGRKSILALFSHLIVRALQAIAYLFAVNIFLPINFGYYQVASSTMAIFSVLSILGFETVHIKIMAESKEENLSFSTFAAIKLFLTLFSSLIIFILILFQIKNGKIENNNAQKQILLIIFIQCFLASLNSIFELSFRAKMNVAKIEIPILIGTTCGAIFSLISIFIFKNFFLYLVGNVLNESIRMILFIRLGREFKFIKLKKKFLLRYVYLNLFLIIPVVLNVLKQNLGPFFFLNNFDEELLGVYSVISMLFVIIKSLQLTLRFLLVPNFTVLIQENQFDELKLSVETFERYMSIINGFLIILGIIFGEFLMRTFIGDIYFEKGIRFYQGSLFSMMVYPLMSGHVSLLVANEKFKTYAIVECINFLFSLFSWIFLIPSFDIIGIDLGLWIAIIPNSIFVRYFCQKNFKIGKISKKFFIHLIFLTLLFYISLNIYEKHYNILYSILWAVFLIFSYILFLFIFKILKKDDINFIKESINPKKMMGYIKNETLNKSKIEQDKNQ